MDGEVAMREGEDGQDEGERDTDVGAVEDGEGIGTARSSSRSFACAEGQRARA